MYSVIHARSVIPAQAGIHTKIASAIDGFFSFLHIAKVFPILKLSRHHAGVTPVSLSEVGRQATKSLGLIIIQFGL